MITQKKYFKKALFTVLGLLAVSLPAAAIQIPNPLGTNIRSPEDLITNVIKTILGVTGSVALIMFVWGGFLWMTSAGNSDKVQKGKNVFIWATAGLIIIFASYAILRTVFEVFK